MRFKLLWALPLAFAPVAAPQGYEVPQRETLQYSIEWRLITAGKARIEWSPRPEARSGYRVNLHMESVGLVSKLFKVDDTYTALVNTSYCVQSAQSKTHEGSRQRETSITFDAQAHKAWYDERDLAKNVQLARIETDIPACTHDLMGGLYYLRTLNMDVQQSMMVPVSDGKKNVMAKVEAQAREEVKTPAGTFRTIRYELYLFNDVLFRRSGHLYVWLTDDRRRLPVQIRARMQITTGTITLQLEKVE